MAEHYEQIYVGWSPDHKDTICCSNWRDLYEWAKHHRDWELHTETRKVPGGEWTFYAHISFEEKPTWITRRSKPEVIMTETFPLPQQFEGGWI